MLKLETTEELIDFAIAREQYAYELYKSIAKKEVYSQVARLCEELAEEELGHKKKLQQKFMRNTAMSSSVDVSDYVVQNDDQKTIFMDYQEFLNFAALKEEKAFKLYKELADKTKDPQCKAIFLALARDEEKHKESLQKKLDDLLK